MGTAKLRYRSKGEMFSKSNECLCAESFKKNSLERNMKQKDLEKGR